MYLYLNGDDLGTYSQHACLQYTSLEGKEMTR